VSGRELRSILVHVPGALGERLAGPEIRATELAKALSVDYEVTLAAEGATSEDHEGIRLVASSRRQLLRESLRHDAILSACLPPYLLALKSWHDLMAISDQYDPHELEIATKDAGRRRDRELRSRAAIQALQLRHSDIVLCAGVRQRAEILGTARSLRACERVDPLVVPFGIPDPPPLTGRRPLRERFPQIGKHDTLVLWWGSVWRWLDAETAVRALARIAMTRSDIKLVITAGRPTRAGAERFYNAAEEVRELASELGVLGSAVLFLDDWIPYQERHDYLRDADIGLTLHRNAAEAQLAARARYMDYLSAELPCVLGRGDETAEEFGAAGFATVLDAPGPNELAATLQALADDAGSLAAARAAGHRLAAQHHWSAVGAELRAALASRCAHMPRRRGAPLELIGGAGAYYGRRLLDRAVGSAEQLVAPAGRPVASS
jgi:glycosyltransferase involved in cell wall biosynthesis